MVGGSIPIKRGSRITNTTLIYDKGEYLDFYDKIHTFDIDIPGKFTSKESEYVQAGNKWTLLNTRFGKFGFGICYDIRFAHFAMGLR